MSGADLLNGWYIFGQTDTMIDIEGAVLLDIAEYDRLTEVNEDCILFNLKSIDLQEDVILLRLFHMNKSEYYIMGV